MHNVHLLCMCDRSIIAVAKNLHFIKYSNMICDGFDHFFLFENLSEKNQANSYIQPGYLSCTFTIILKVTSNFFIRNKKLFNGLKFIHTKLYTM